MKKSFWALLFLPLVAIYCAKVKVSEEEITRNFNSCISRGYKHLSERDYESAIKDFKNAISLKPDSERAHNFLGIAYFMEKSFKLAEDEFKKAISLNSYYSPAYSNLGNVYLKLNQWEKAEDSYKKAMELSPDSPSPYYSLGNMLLSLGRFEEGVSYLMKGFQIDPNFMEKEATLKTELTELTTNAGELYFAYSKLFASAGDVEKTIEYLERAKKSGFNEWFRILKEKEFEKVRDNPKIRKFIQ